MSNQELLTPVQVKNNQRSLPGSFNTSIESVTNYLNDVEKKPLLKVKEEQKLGARMFVSRLVLFELMQIKDNPLLTDSQKKSIRVMFEKPHLVNLAKPIYAEENKNRSGKNPATEIRKEKIRSKIMEIYSRFDKFVNRHLDTQEKDRVDKFIVKWLGLVERGNNARETLFESNLRLVISIAKKQLGKGATLDDLIQEGNIGLASAIDKFNFHLGYKFSTYGTWWIKQAITRSIITKVRPVRIPVHTHEKMNKMVKTRIRLSQEIGRTPTAREIADELSISLDSVDEMDKNRQSILSLDHKISAGGISVFGDLIEDTRQDLVSLGIRSVAKRELIGLLSKVLTVREQEILALRFGLRDDRERTLREVSTKFGITRERIRQIEAGAINKLRLPENSEKLRDLLD